MVSYNDKNNLSRTDDRNYWWWSIGRMMALAAKEAGFKIAVLDPTMDSPCGQVSDIQIVAPYNDETALEELAEVSDVITYEFENIDYDGLKRLSEIAYVPQGAELVRITQNRILEKAEIRAAGVPVAKYVEASTYEELVQRIDEVGFPCVVKTARGGYDGKGQQIIQTKEQLTLAKLCLNILHVLQKPLFLYKRNFSHCPA